MSEHYGFKAVKATPMTRLTYSEYRGWQLPTNENGADEGFLVEYVDGGQANDSRHAGYISWSPKEVFERSYKASGQMSFGMAVEALKEGKSVSRAGWNGKGMYLFIIQGSNDIAKLHGYGFGELLGEPIFSDAIFLKTPANELVPWTASQADVLANDWGIAA